MCSTDFELAYKTEDGFLIIPHLLLEDQPEELLKFSRETSLMMKYEADKTLPENTISRFIIRYNQLIQIKDKKPQVWRYGVVLEKEDGTIALVREDDRAISIEIRGNSKTKLVGDIRNDFESIFKTYKSKIPELEYRVRNFGEIDRPEDLFLPQQTIQSYVAENRPYFDPLTKVDLPLNKSAKEYNIQVNNYYAPVNNTNIQNIFNFRDCNFDLQAGFDDLLKKLKKTDLTEDIEEVEDIIESLDEVKDLEDKEAVKKKGVIKAVKKFIEDVGDEKSKLNHFIKGSKKLIGKTQDIAKEYNKLAQWLALPQVPTPFLKKENH